jgi:hypothetical protein
MEHPYRVFNLDPGSQMRRQKVHEETLENHIEAGLWTAIKKGLGNPSPSPSF